MALTSGQFRRSWLIGASDADGRRVQIETGGIEDTKGITVTAAAPGATTTVTTLSGLTTLGVYRVRVVVALTGTAETAPVNLVFRQSAVQIIFLPTISGQIVTCEFPRVTLTTGTTMDARTIAAATAGSVYTVQICATRVE